MSAMPAVTLTCGSRTRPKRGGVAAQSRGAAIIRVARRSQRRLAAAARDPAEAPSEAPRRARTSRCG